MSTILQHWTKSDDQKKDERIQLSLDMLRSRADGHLVDAKGAVLDAKAALNAAYKSAEKKPDFQAIVDARMNLAAAELFLEEANETYAEIFGS